MQDYKGNSNTAVHFLGYFEVCDMIVFSINTLNNKLWQIYSYVISE